MTKTKILLGVIAGVAAGTLLSVALAARKSKPQKRLIQKGSQLAGAFHATIDERFKDLLSRAEKRFARNK